jgi:hypothetical protein
LPLDGPVELLGLCHAHVVDLEPDDRQSSARKMVNDSSEPGVWKPKVVRLGENQRLFDILAGGIRDAIIQQSTVGV